MREPLKTEVTKYPPKIESSITIENVKGIGLQLVVIYAGKKFYSALSTLPQNPKK